MVIWRYCSWIVVELLGVLEVGNIAQEYTDICILETNFFHSAVFLKLVSGFFHRFF